MLTTALPLLVAVLIAFAGGDPVARPGDGRPPEGWTALAFEAMAGMALAASVAMGIGLGLSAAIRRSGLPDYRSRRAFDAAGHFVRATNLAVFAWLILGLDWRSFVASGLGLRGAFLLDEVLVLLPYLGIEVLGWWGLYPAARAARAVRGPGGVFDYLIRRVRLTFGLTLPPLLLYWAGLDGVGQVLGDRAKSPEVQAGVLAGLGAVLLLVSPAFVRLAWPTRPLPAGPLRDRLDRLAARFSFRHADILVWDTGGTVPGAAITGILPGYRYVVLSDRLIDQLDGDEVAAVFGHEMGHVAHRHAVFLGLFFLGSFAVMALLTQAVNGAFALLPASRGASSIEVGKTVVTLGAIGGYFWLVFGALSRRFERQADVFGCRAVSCGREDCPPHHDGLQAPQNPGGGSRIDPAGGVPGPLCPVGIRTCAGALATLADKNGIDPDVWRWRHGSISNRIEFLLGLEGRPADERRFQVGVTRLRVLLLLMLVAAVALAGLSGAFETFRAS